MLFNVGNVAVWAGCLSTGFGWDERAVAAVLVFVMTAFVIILGDATCSNFEYSNRSIFLVFVTLLCLSDDVGDLSRWLIGWLGRAD